MQGASLDSIEGKLSPQGERASLFNRAIVEAMQRHHGRPYASSGHLDPPESPLPNPNPILVKSSFARSLPQSLDRSSALCDKGEPRTDLEFERTLKRTFENRVMKIFAKFNKTIEREREIPETIRKHKDILRIMSQEGDWSSFAVCGKINCTYFIYNSWDNCDYFVQRELYNDIRNI